MSQQLRVVPFLRICHCLIDGGYKMNLLFLPCIKISFPDDYSAKELHTFIHEQLIEIDGGFLIRVA